MKKRVSTYVRGRYRSNQSYYTYQVLVWNKKNQVHERIHCFHTNYSNSEQQ